MPSVGFEPAISIGDCQQTLALDRSATGIGSKAVCFRFDFQGNQKIRVSIKIQKHELFYEYRPTFLILRNCG